MWLARALPRLLNEGKGRAASALTATRATAHTRAVQETGRHSGADGSVVTGTPTGALFVIEHMPWDHALKVNVGGVGPDRPRRRGPAAQGR